MPDDSKRERRFSEEEVALAPMALKDTLARVARNHFHLQTRARTS